MKDVTLFVSAPRIFAAAAPASGLRKRPTPPPASVAIDSATMNLKSCDARPDFAFAAASLISDVT